MNAFFKGAWSNVLRGAGGESAAAARARAGKGPGAEATEHSEHLLPFAPFAWRPGLPRACNSTLLVRPHTLLSMGWQLEAHPPTPPAACRRPAPR